MAAPSVTYEAFPAVVLPPFLKDGLSLASPYRLVPSRIPSSFETRISLEFPSLSTTVAFTGTISESNNPFF